MLGELFKSKSLGTINLQNRGGAMEKPIEDKFKEQERTLGEAIAQDPTFDNVRQFNSSASFYSLVWARNDDYVTLIEKAN